MLVAASNPKELWYLTRGFGLVDLVLLTLSVVIGIVQVRRLSAARLPRFVVAAVHRNISLLALAFLAVHIATAVSDPYAPIRIADIFLPFGSRYRPLWLGLGALASDLMLALVLTSLVRDRIGYRTWKAVHWAAYACWPVALVHGLGTGSDSRLQWVHLLYAACTLAVLVGLAGRLFILVPAGGYRRRAVAGASAVLLTAAVVLWAEQGPFKAGWAKRASAPAPRIDVRTSGYS